MVQLWVTDVKKPMDHAPGGNVKLVTIPKLIMQTWKTSEVPERWVPSPASVESHMSDWSYVFMTDEDNRHFVETYFPDFLETYDSFPYNIQRADAIRYMWLYVNGGLYLDLDYLLNGPLDSLFYEGNGLYLMASPNTPSYYTNSVMASRAGHPFWLEVIEKMKSPSVPYWALSKHFKVMYTTGPCMLTQVVRDSHYGHTVIPYKLVSPRTMCCRSMGDSGMLTPLEGCSWGACDSSVYVWTFCNPWSAVCLILVVVLIIYILVVAARIASRGSQRQQRPGQLVLS